MRPEALLKFTSHFGFGAYPAHEAALSGDSSRWKSLGRLNPDSELPLGDRALHAAAHCGSVDGLQALLRVGADPNSRTRERYTPLHFAACPFVREYYDFASEELSVEACRILLRGGAELEAKDGQHRSPLLLGLLHPRAGVVRQLLGAGADARVSDRRGWSPLHVVCGQGCVSVEVYELLLAHGADPSARDEEGHTASDLWEREVRANWWGWADDWPVEIDTITRLLAW